MKFNQEMKRMVKNVAWGLLTLCAVVGTSCSDDDNGASQEATLNLVTPEFRAYVNDREAEQPIPMTGLLDVYPCKSGTSIYFGNYVNDKLTVFNGLYAIENGHIYAGSGRKLSLPQDSYNLLYWGTPIYDDPIYSTPEIVNPGLSLDADLSSLYLELRKNYGEETYHPVYDLVYGLEETNVGTEDLSATLRRVVAGLKVTVTNKDGSVIASDVSKMEVCIGGIAEKLNFFTAEPVNQTKTVKFELQRSADGKQMANNTVMLFPSSDNPQLDLLITLTSGQVITLTQQLKETLSADTRLNLSIVLGDMIVGEESGSFTIQADWHEKSETIEFPVIN